MDTCSGENRTKKESQVDVEIRKMSDEIDRLEMEG